VKQVISREESLKMISDVLKQQFNTDTKEFHYAKEAQLKKYQKKREEIELERKNYRRDALKMGYSREEIEETTKDMDDAIKLVESQIMELSDNTNMEEYLEKLPNMLLKTAELTITNKKELKVKLFEVLDRLVNSDFSILDALECQ